ncbi:hypothetical protein EV143_1242 [Flavobacterium chryseum]|nr:hypothetical protein EV143_1242 [Flavobacterium sp. P3160]
MNRCPVTYEPCGDDLYSREGLKKLSPKLVSFHNLPFSASEQRQEAVNRASKLSIQGVQPKLSAHLGKVSLFFFFEKVKLFDLIDF